MMIAMKNETTIVFNDHYFKRFDLIGSTSKELNSPIICQTVVKVKRRITLQGEPYSTEITVKNIKWSKYRLINWFKRIWIIVKYR